MRDLISRQAAIDAINKAFERVFAWDRTSPLGDKVLENVPSAQPDVPDTNVGDCISRQAAINVIDAVFPVDPMKSEYAQGIACGAALAKTYVEQLPSAQPEVIPHMNYKYLSDYWCECGWHLGKRGDMKYCPDCGRKVKWDG